jgi:hypothetical protein
VTSPKLDRAAVMRDAHLRYRQGLRLALGWTFAQCLSTAWAAAKIRQGHTKAYHFADRRRTHTRDFIFISAQAA